MRPITLRPKAGADWATEIRRLWAEGEFRVIELAKAVVRAKLQLRRGEWTALWLDSNVPFSQRKAEMLSVSGARFILAVDGEKAGTQPYKLLKGAAHEAEREDEAELSVGKRQLQAPVFGRPYLI